MEKAGSSCLLLQRKTNEKKKVKIAKELPSCLWAFTVQKDILPLEMHWSLMTIC